MNFLLFTLEYPPFKGGVANYYENLVNYWPDEKIYVLANKQIGAVSNNRILFKGIITKFIFPKWILGFYFLFKTVKKNKIDHVIVGHILPLGTITYILSKILHFKYTVIMHGMDFDFAIKSKRKKYLTKKILKNADIIICGNNYLAELVKKNMKIKNIKIVNPSISKNSVVLNKNLKNKIIEKYNLENKKILLSIGRLMKRKGFDKVIEVFPEIITKDNNLIYVIIGKGKDEEYLKNKIKSLSDNIQKKIILLNNVNEEEKWVWLFLSDVFVMPSRNINGDFEGFGIVYLEANLAKLPIVAGDSGGVRDAVIDNLNGLLVNPENNFEIKNAILKLISNKKLRKDMGLNGYNRVTNDFNVKVQIKKIYDFYNNTSL